MTLDTSVPIEYEINKNKHPRDPGDRSAFGSTSYVQHRGPAARPSSAPSRKTEQATSAQEPDASEETNQAQCCSGKQQSVEEGRCSRSRG